MNIDELREKYNSQRERNDPLRYVTFSNIKFEEGKNSLYSGSYSQANINFQESVEALVENFTTVKGFSDTTVDKNEMLAKAKRYIIDRLSYIAAIKILTTRDLVNANEIEAIVDGLLRSKIYNVRDAHLGISEKLYVAEKAITLACFIPPYELIKNDELVKSLLNIEEFKYLDELTYLHFKRRLLVNLVNRFKSGALPNENEYYPLIADYFKKLAVLEKRIENGIETSQYFSDLADHYRFLAYSSITESTFWKYYKKMLESLEEYVDLEFKSQNSIRRANLDKAYALTQALRIVNTLDDKLKITVEIVAYFTEAKSYNAERFSIYRRWYQTVKIITRDKANNSDAVKKIVEKLAELPSIKKTDRDEDYISTNIPELLITRDNLNKVDEFLDYLIKKPMLVDVGVPVLNSALVLYSNNYLDIASAYQILKTFIVREVEKIDSPEPLSLFAVEDKKDSNMFLNILSNGETDEVEFKESWRYDPHTKVINNDVESSALIAIVAFLNTNGGTLFIGVNDHGELTGLENTDFKIYGKDSQKYKDKFKLQIDNSVSHYINRSFNSFIKINFTSEDGKTVAIIKVSKASKRAWYYNDSTKTDAHFYIRASASSRELIGEEVYEYSASRFNNK